MSSVTMKTTYLLEVSGAEFTLITKALAGKLKPQQQPEAEVLETQLSRQRLVQMKELAKQAESLEKHLEAGDLHNLP